MKRLSVFLASALLALALAPARAAEYQLLIHESAEELAKREDRGPAGQAYWKAYADFGAALQQAGVLRGGAALAPALLAREGSSTPAQPRLGGWFVIEAPSAQAAARWAAQVPAVQSGGSVEVRALYPVPGMNAAR